MNKNLLNAQDVSGLISLAEAYRASPDDLPSLTQIALSVVHSARGPEDGFVKLLAWLKEFFDKGHTQQQAHNTLIYHESPLFREAAPFFQTIHIKLDD